MAQITATMVKELREETQQGMMECKKALTEADGDMDAARDILRMKVGAMVTKKAERQTTEGLVGIVTTDDGTSVAMVEISCETDFCARNEVFQAMVDDVAAQALSGQAGAIEATDAITGAVEAVLAKIGENMGYVRGVKIAAAKTGFYRHHNKKVGVIVGLDGDLDEETLSGLCMHIAFSDPMGISVADIPADLIEKERAFATQQAVESGKPQEIAEMMVEGKMKKFAASKALVEQAYVRDEKKTIKEILGGVTVTAFARFAIGG